MHIRAWLQPAEPTAAASAVLAGDSPASALGRRDHPKLCTAAGQSIAVACGRFDIQGWCSQPGLLAVWNLARSGLDPSRPGQALEVDTCLQCCSYHPEHPVRLLCCHSASLLMQCRHPPPRQLEWAAVHMQTAGWPVWAAVLLCRHSVLLQSASSDCTQAPCHLSSGLGILGRVTELHEAVGCSAGAHCWGHLQWAAVHLGLGAARGPSTGHLQHQRGGTPVSGCALPDTPAHGRSFVRLCDHLGNEARTPDALLALQAAERLRHSGTVCAVA